MALSMRARAAGDGDLARTVDPDFCAFVRSVAGSFDVAGDPDPEVTACLPGLRLALTETGVADRFQCGVQLGGVVTAVIDEPRPLR